MTASLAGSWVERRTKTAALDQEWNTFLDKLI
jgi:hypothetical protein